ncbi:hypothetical protein CLOM_g24584 [Closterium sp. NIES-68]|nr:hypothetical protein CLOM_g24584 [Closterium sp. NIES-68]
MDASERRPLVPRAVRLGEHQSGDPSHRSSRRSSRQHGGHDLNPLASIVVFCGYGVALLLAFNVMRLGPASPSSQPVAACVAGDSRGERCDWATHATHQVLHRPWSPPVAALAVLGFSLLLLRALSAQAARVNDLERRLRGVCGQQAGEGGEGDALTGGSGGEEEEKAEEKKERMGIEARQVEGEGARGEARMAAGDSEAVVSGGGAIAASAAAGVLIHEIAAPMRGVVGMLRLLASSVSDPMHLDLIHTLHAFAAHLTRLAAAASDTWRAQNGPLPVLTSAVDVRMVVDEVVAAVGGEAREKGVEVACLVMEDVPSLLRSDALRLKQLLLCVASSAVQHTEQGHVLLCMRLLHPTEVKLHQQRQHRGAQQKHRVVTGIVNVGNQDGVNALHLPPSRMPLPQPMHRHPLSPSPGTAPTTAPTAPFPSAFSVPSSPSSLFSSPDLLGLGGIARRLAAYAAPWSEQALQEQPSTRSAVLASLSIDSWLQQGGLAQGDSTDHRQQQQQQEQQEQEGEERGRGGSLSGQRVVDGRCSWGALRGLLETQEGRFAAAITLATSAAAASGGAGSGSGGGEVWVEVVVEDTGSGVPQPVLDTLNAMPPHAGHAAPLPHALLSLHAATPLLLAHAQLLASTLGGSLSIATAPAIGTTVSFAIPMALPPLAPIPSSSPALPTSAPSSRSPPHAPLPPACLPASAPPFPRAGASSSSEGGLAALVGLWGSVGAEGGLWEAMGLGGGAGQGVGERALGSVAAGEGAWEGDARGEGREGNGGGGGGEGRGRGGWMGEVGVREVGAAERRAVREMGVVGAVGGEQWEAVWALVEQLRGVRCLVVDGNPIRQQVTASFVSRLGVDVDLSDSVPDAIAALQCAPPAVHPAAVAWQGGVGNGRSRWDVVVVDADCDGTPGSGLLLGSHVARINAAHAAHNVSAQNAEQAARAAHAPCSASAAAPAASATVVSAGDGEPGRATAASGGAGAERVGGGGFTALADEGMGEEDEGRGGLGEGGEQRGSGREGCGAMEGDGREGMEEREGAQVACSGHGGGMTEGREGMEGRSEWGLLGGRYEESRVHSQQQETAARQQAEQQAQQQQWQEAPGSAAISSKLVLVAQATSEDMAVAAAAHGFSCIALKPLRTPTLATAMLQALGVSAREVQQAAVQQQQVHLRRLLRGKVVLVVDPCFQTRKAAAVALSQFADAACAVASPADALSRLAPPHDFHLVLLSLYLPDLPPTQFVQRVREMEAAAALGAPAAAGGSGEGAGAPKGVAEMPKSSSGSSVGVGGAAGDEGASSVCGAPVPVLGMVTDVLTNDLPPRLSDCRVDGLLATPICESQLLSTLRSLVSCGKFI